MSVKQPCESPPRKNFKNFQNQLNDYRSTQKDTWFENLKSNSDQDDMREAKRPRRILILLMTKLKKNNETEAFFTD